MAVAYPMANNLFPERVFGVILAGGEGSRFQPLSSPEYPKQFLHLFGEQSLLQQTYRRVSTIIPETSLYLITNNKYRGLVQEHLPTLPCDRIIGEPVKRNTGPAIGYMVHLFHASDPDAIVMFLPADHYIGDERMFAEKMQAAIALARRADRLVLFGVAPTWPATGYGYIRSGNVVDAPCTAFHIAQFEEKPGFETAQKYYSAGHYYWNTGIFIGTVSRWMQEFAAYAPDLCAALKNFSAVEKFRNEFFERTSAAPIDTLLMEKTSNILMCLGDFGWSDVGSWESVRRLRDDGVKIAASVEEVLMTMTNDRGVAATRWVKKPWGHEEIWAHSEHYVGKILFILRDHQLSYQYHRVKEETLRVLTGKVEVDIEINDHRQTLCLDPGDVLHVPPFTKHRIRAIEDSKVIEVSTPHLEDIERIEDDYGRIVPIET